MSFFSYALFLAFKSLLFLSRVVSSLSVLIEAKTWPFLTWSPTFTFTLVTFPCWTKVNFCAFANFVVPAKDRLVEISPVCTSYSVLKKSVLSSWLNRFVHTPYPIPITTIKNQRAHRFFCRINCQYLLIIFLINKIKVLSLRIYFFLKNSSIFYFQKKDSHLFNELSYILSLRITSEFPTLKPSILGQTIHSSLLEQNLKASFPKNILVLQVVSPHKQ